MSSECLHVHLIQTLTEDGFFNRLNRKSRLWASVRVVSWRVLSSGHFGLVRLWLNLFKQRMAWSKIVNSYLSTTNGLHIVFTLPSCLKFVDFAELRVPTRWNFYFFSIVAQDVFHFLIWGLCLFASLVEKIVDLLASSMSSMMSVTSPTRGFMSSGAMCVVFAAWVTGYSTMLPSNLKWSIQTNFFTSPRLGLTFLCK